MKIPIRTVEEMSEQERREYLEAAVVEAVVEDSAILVAEEWTELTKLAQKAMWSKRTKPFTCAEIARGLEKHPDTVYKWFEDYPGVIKISHPAKRMKVNGEWRIKQKHNILHIPPDVLLKWLNEHTKR